MSPADMPRSIIRRLSSASAWCLAMLSAKAATIAAIGTVKQSRIARVPGSRTGARNGREGNGDAEAIRT